MAITINNLVIGSGSITGHSHPDTRVLYVSDNGYKSFNICGTLGYDSYTKTLFEVPESDSDSSKGSSSSSKDPE